MAEAGQTNYIYVQKFQMKSSESQECLISSLTSRN